MADFKTHIACSSVLGVAYGGAACVLYDVPTTTGLLAGTMCGVAGMMPDLDSDSGVPQRESIAFAAAVAPMLLIQRLREFGVPSEALVVAGALAYVAIRFGVGFLLRAFTVHRGMFHSIPAALIAGELTFLMASGDDVALRWYKAGGVILGYLSHLMLDEVYSVQTTRLRVKRSFGTALKLFDRRHLWPNLSAYAKLAILSYIVLYEPGWTADYRQEVAQWGNSKVVQNALKENALGGLLTTESTPDAVATEPAAPLVPIDRTNVGQAASGNLWR